MKPRTHIRRDGSAGFTLLEVLLATFIAALVIGIMTVSLSFTLRLWQKNQLKVPQNGNQLLELLKLQLGSIYRFPITIKGKKGPLFSGTPNELVFATAYGVRALSKGAPVIARYQFYARDKKIFYSEMPFDPYHEERTKNFLEARPGEDEERWPHFYAMGAEDFSFSYWDSERDEFESGWEEKPAPPSLVRIRVQWKEDDPAVNWYFAPGFLMRHKKQGQT